MTDKDTERVKKTLQGDASAYGELVGAYRGMVFAVALNITGNYSDSEDVVQEAFLRAYQKLRTLSDPAKFASWLYTLAKRVALQLLRERHRVPMTPGEAYMADRADPDALTPAEIYAKDELGRLLWSQVAELPPKTREAILLYYMEGFSIKGGAALLGITEGAMKMRLEFGREKLREAVLRNVEDELRRHQPSEKTRAAILGALPPLVGIRAPMPWASAAKVAASAASAKPIVAVMSAVLILAASLFLFARYHAPHTPTPVSPPIAVGRTDADDRPPAIPAPSVATPSTPPPDPTPAMPHVLAGRVVERYSNNPVADATVRLERGADKLKEAATDAQGAFEFPALVEGHYTLRLDLNKGDLLRRYCARAEDSRVEVNLTAGDARGVVLALSPATYIAGRVVDDKGEPVASADLQLSSENHAQAHVSSGERGEFRFDGLTPGSYYSLECKAEGHASWRMENLQDPGAPIDNLIVRLSAGKNSVIRGRVVNRQSQPLEDVPVKALTGGISSKTAYATTKSDGSFEFTDLAPGSVVVMAEVEEEQPSRSLGVKPGETLEGIELVLDLDPQRGRVSGVMQNANGQPLTAGDVFAYASKGKGEQPGPRFDDEARLSAAVPDAEGRFTLANLMPGARIDVLYRGPSGPPQSTSAVDVRVPSEGVAATFDGNVRYSNSQSDERRITISGKVVDSETGKPIQQFVVGAGGDRSPVMFDPLGLFEFKDVPYFPERTTVFVAAEGYAQRSYTVEAAPGVTSVTLDVRLDRGGSIEGRVVNAAGAAVAGARVYATFAPEVCVVSDGHGLFRLDHLQARDDLRLGAVHPDYAPYRGEPLVSDGNTAIRNALIVLSKGGAIAGTVFDEAGKPVSGAELTIYLNGVVANPYTDERGSYAVTRLPEGDYQVTVAANSVERRLVRVTEGATVRADFGDPGASTIVGLITQDGAPMAQVHVVASSADSFFRDQDSGFRVESITDSGGRYRLDRVPRGRCYLMVAHEMGVMACLAVDVPESQELTQDIALRTGSVHGRVVGFAGGPKSPLTVRAYRTREDSAQNPEDIAGFATAANDGTFELNRLAPGAYRLEADADKQGATPGIEVVVQPGQTVDGAVLEFPR